MSQVHQFVHSYVDHDATSSHARHLRRVINEMGIPSEVYASEWRGPLSKATPFAEYASRGETSDTWLLYQLSTASPIADFLTQRSERVAINYHNITPAQLIRPWEPTLAAELDVAREQLLGLAKYTEIAVGVSRFNEAELRAAEYSETTVAPVLFDPSEFDRALDPRTHDQLRRAKDRGGADWLFVGRVAPHKCLHDVIKAFSLYQRIYDERARLHLVGGMWSHRYWTVLHQYMAALDVSRSVNVTKGISHAALSAYYRNADVFVYLSEHEGFGVPVLEAFHNRIPVVAYDSSAVGETIGDGGLLLADKAASTVAAATARVLTDSELRSDLVASGVRQLGRFALQESEARWREVITRMVESRR